MYKDAPSTPSDKKRILIDSAHPEETRVAFIRQGVLEHFQYETPQKRSLKGNVYLASITNVDPSLQAAFVSLVATAMDFWPSIKFILTITSYP